MSTCALYWYNGLLLFNAYVLCVIVHVHIPVPLPLQTMNFDLTHSLLDLVAMYASIMILFGQIDDRKAIAGLYNVAHEAVRGSTWVYMLFWTFAHLSWVTKDWDDSHLKEWHVLNVSLLLFWHKILFLYQTPFRRHVVFPSSACKIKPCIFFSFFSWRHIREYCYVGPLPIVMHVLMTEYITHDRVKAHEQIFVFMYTYKVVIKVEVCGFHLFKTAACLAPITPKNCFKATALRHSRWPKNWSTVLN